MAAVSLVQVLAIILGPAIAAGFSGIDVKLWGDFNIDSMTMPGFFSALCAIITVILLFFFNESARPSQAYLEAQSEHKSLGGMPYLPKPFNKHPTYDDLLPAKLRAYIAPPTSANKWAIYACIYLSFTFGVSFTVFETVGTAMVSDVRTSLFCLPLQMSLTPELSHFSSTNGELGKMACSTP